MSGLVVPQKIFLNRLPVSDQILLIAGILLIGVVIVLLLVVFRLQRNLRGMRQSDRFLREDFGRLSQNWLVNWIIAKQFGRTRRRNRP